MKNVNKMRGIVGSIASVILVLNFTSCADIEADQSDFQLPAGRFEAINSFERNVFGIYGTMNRTARKTTFHAATWAGDDITTFRAANKADFRQFDQRNVETTNTRLLDNWNGLYNIINNASNALARAEGLSDLFNEEEEVNRINRISGEALFLRAISYHMLVRVHGDIPLNNELFPSSAPVKAGTLAVYEQIESDLLTAIELLPDLYPDVLAGAPRPNKGSARSILARVYMDWAGFPLRDTSKYDLAMKTAKEVMDNAEAHNFRMLENFEDLWRQDANFVDESVFSLIYLNVTGETNFLEQQKFGAVGISGDFGGWEETFAEIRYFEDFPKGPRKDATFRMDVDWKNFTTQASPLFAKIAGLPSDSYGTQQFQTNKSDFFMRYPEVLLIYAEAAGRSGNVTPEAWEALNVVRRRANGLPLNTPDASVDLATGDIAELAFTERKWEFGGEYLRWWDLVRMERVEEALSNRNPQVSRNAAGDLLEETNAIIGSLGTDNYFSPIPQSIQEEAPSLKD